MTSDAENFLFHSWVTLSLKSPVTFPFNPVRVALRLSGWDLAWTSRHSSIRKLANDVSFGSGICPDKVTQYHLPLTFKKNPRHRRRAESGALGR